MVEPDSTHTSPDGRVRIQYSSEEMRMSLWVDKPHVVSTETGRTIFKPNSSLISGDHEWGESGQFSLNLREYPDGSFWVKLHFDIDAGTVRLDHEDEAHPIERASRLVADQLRRYKRAAIAAAVMEEPKRFVPFRDLWETKWGRVRLSFIILCIAMIVGIATGWFPLDEWVGRLI